MDHLQNSMHYELNQTQQAFQNALDNLKRRKTTGNWCRLITKI